MRAWFVLGSCALAACDPPRSAPPSPSAASGAALDAAGPTRDQLLALIRADLDGQVVALESITCPAGDLLALRRFDCEVAFTAHTYRFRWTRPKTGTSPGTWTGEVRRLVEPVTVQLSATDALVRFARLSHGSVTMIELPPTVLVTVASTIAALGPDRGLAFDRVECDRLIADVPSTCAAAFGAETTQVDVRVQRDPAGWTVKAGWREHKGGACPPDRVDPYDPEWCRARYFPAVVTWIE